MKYLNKRITYANEALKLSTETDLIQLKNYASKSLMNAYKELGNKNKAFTYAEILFHHYKR